jgi:hypothetical protein
MFGSVDGDGVGGQAIVVVVVGVGLGTGVRAQGWMRGKCLDILEVGNRSGDVRRSDDLSPSDSNAVVEELFVFRSHCPVESKYER